MRGFSEILLTDLENPLLGEHHEFVTIIHQTSGQMLGLVNDLLDVAAIESGRIDLLLQPESLGPLLENRIRITQVVAAKKNIALRHELGSVPEFPFDANCIIQVVDNLVTNAVKFSPPGSAVRIGLELSETKLGAMATVSVADEGPGLSPGD